MESVVPPRRRGRALVWWVLAAAALLVGRAVANGFMPGIAHDSFQYLSTAEQALSGRFGETGVVHFDAERTFGRVPAPLVTFPLGYPSLIALARLAGVSLMHAALLVNLAAALGCVVLAWWLSGRLGLRPGIRGAVMAAIVFSGALLQFAVTASTEMTFTLLVTGGAALLWRARKAGQGVRWWIASGVAFGAAYHVRYAGLFLIVGLFGLAARHVLSRRRPLILGYGVAAATASLFVAVGMARNILLVGNWRGGNEKAVSNALGGVLAQTMRAVNGLVMGPPGTAPALSLVLRILFVAAVVIAAALLWRARRRRSAPDAPSPETWDYALDLLLLIGAYSALMFYAALTTVISYGTRMFVPLIPLLALLAGVWLSRWLPAGDAPLHKRSPALAAAFGLYVVLNAISFANPLVDRATVVQAQLRGRTDSGATIRELIDGTGRGVIVANHGQALGFLLRRPTVSLVGPHYSTTVWDEQTVRAVVERYSAAVLVITGPNEAQPPSTDLIPSTFIESLMRGEAPAWMRLAGRSGPVSVYVPDAGR